MQEILLVFSLHNSNFRHSFHHLRALWVCSAYVLNEQDERGKYLGSLWESLIIVHWRWTVSAIILVIFCKNFEIRRTEMVVKFVFLTYTEQKQGSFDNKDPLRPFLHFPFITFLLARHTEKINPPTDDKTFFRWWGLRIWKNIEASVFPNRLFTL